MDGCEIIETIPSTEPGTRNILPVSPDAEVTFNGNWHKTLIIHEHLFSDHCESIYLQNVNVNGHHVDVP